MVPVLPRAQRARGSNVRASKAPRRSQYKSLLASPSCVSLSEEPSALFVCLGNVCRSPTAEAVLKRKLEKHSLSRSVFVDSCSLGGGSRSWWWHEGGVSYHEGDPADARMRSVASKRKIHLTSTSRPLTKHDLHFFHKILCADDLNLQIIDDVLKRWSSDGTGWELPSDGVMPRVFKILDFAPSGTNAAEYTEVPDPYDFDDIEPFERVLDLVDEAADGLLQSLITEYGLQPAAQNS